jgi:2-phosphosulfolactate phosphatase
MEKGMGKIKFQRAVLDTCSEVEGLAVVIDVLRAFSTAAYALGNGARELILTDTVEGAKRLRARFSQALLMGEQSGHPLEGFDYGNSPDRIKHVDFSGRLLIQRTSAGTQGVVRSELANPIFAGSLLVASATARHILRLDPPSVTFVITGANAAGWSEDMIWTKDGWGDEDAACADYLEELLSGYQPDPEPYLRRVWDSPAGKIFQNPDIPALPYEDLPLCAQIDTFDFALPVERRDGLLVLRASY